MKQAAISTPTIPSPERSTGPTNQSIPLLASALVTGSDLVFTGDPEGFFFALDAKTGQKLWSFNTGSGHRGSPITYSVNNKQYIAVPVGWGSAVAGLFPQIWPETEAFPGGCTLFVFALTE